MNYLQAENLSKAYGEKVLFFNISFSLEKGQKTAIIAQNGTGKSSLLRIVAGLDAPDSGKITFRNNLKVNYLEQNPEFESHKTILDTLFSADTELTRVIHDYEHALEYAHTHSGEDANNRLNESILQMDAAHAWDYETHAREILGQFDINDLSQTIGSLSGGQRKKVALAKALIGSPDLLILDEPTNHLDFSMIEWLEEYLSRETLSLLLVTHDRYFLDNVCDTILEMDRNNIYTYKGNYSYYLEQKDERLQLEDSSVEKAKNLYRTELEWIRRMPKARGTKSRARIQAFDELETKAKTRRDDNSIKFNTTGRPLGGKIVEIDNLFKNFGDFKAIYDFSYIFKRGEKIGVVGLNGTGKSTLLNLISGRLKPDKGKITIGQTVKMGYYTQDGLQLKEDKRVIDVVKDVAEEIKLTGGSSLSASQFLYKFNFSYPVQQAYFSSLSGGEKRRLYLLLQLIGNPNFLLLDEPTNDLDIYTLQVLEDFLQDFAGCVIIVSHDRFLLDKVCDHVFVFEGNGKIKDFYGNYTTYYQHRIEEQKRLQRAEKQAKTESKPTKETKPVSNKPTYKQLKEFELLEFEIGILEKEKEALLNELHSGLNEPIRLNEISIRFGAVENELDEKTLRWMELADIIGS